MTNKEAIEILNQYRKRLTDSVSNQLDKDIEAFEIAIKNLENQKSIIEKLEKIKSEIDTLYGVYLSCFTERLVIKSDVMRIFDEHISELKGESK